MKGELHLLFEIAVVCVLNHNKFFGITMLFEFFFLHFECNFELFLQVQVHLLCMIVQLHFVLMFVDELAVAGCIVPSDGFASA